MISFSHGLLAKEVVCILMEDVSMDREVSGLHMPLGFEFFGTLVLSDFFGLLQLLG